MKSLLMSIHPKWCELIASGEKTIEVRKTAPKPPFKVYMYCTQPKGNFNCPKWTYGKYLEGHKDYFEVNGTQSNGKVIGEFVCERVSKYSDADLSYFEFTKELNGLDKYPIENGTCLTLKQMHE